MTRHRKVNSNKSHQKCYFVGKSNGKTLNYDCTLQMTTCQYTKDDGDLCKRRTVNGLGLCYFHLALQQGLRIHLKNQTLHTTATKRYLPDEEIYRFQQIPQTAGAWSSVNPLPFLFIIAINGVRRHIQQTHQRPQPELV